MVDYQHVDPTINPRTRSVIEKEDISIYPNPTVDNFVNISINQMHDGAVYSTKVYNAVGALIVNEVLENDTKTIDVGNEVGIKFIIIFKDGEIISSEKIVRI